MLSILLASSLAWADPLSDPETSYYGASILDGDSEVMFDEVLNIDQELDPDTYAFFEGSTLYVGNSDDYGNSVDGIIEFFWFQSSIDRGTDFYVAVVKVRATPGSDCPWYLGGTECELWADDWQDWGEYPVISVEAITDVSREQGAFRWDWAVPFENYGIDAYGQMSFSNQYGVGGSSQSGAEGSAMSAVNIPEGTNINGVPVQGGANVSADVQVKGYLGSEYKVQTQYDVTLYEWDVYVNGRADLMAWDVFLNLGARSDQSAYHEFFLPLQVEFGQPFTMDEFNFLSTFDIGNINPFAYQLGFSVQNLTITAPFWEEPEEEIVEEPSTEPTSEPTVEIIEPSTEPEEDSGVLDEDQLTIDSQPVKSGCNAAPVFYDPFSISAILIFSLYRRQK
tara:strand:+ start:903 stop:2084 length:1182 start_codon:yes stop_codon:yes gene_type:complete